MLRALYICLTVVASGWLASAAAQLADLSPPGTSFDDMVPPPAPDYKRTSSRAVCPGVRSKADIVPPGAQPERATQPEADVFFIHPTTYLGNDTWNAPYDASGFTGQQLNESVVGYQASIFNACCRSSTACVANAAVSRLDGSR